MASPNAGTLYVQVVPSMKGFKNAVEKSVHQALSRVNLDYEQIKDSQEKVSENIDKSTAKQKEHAKAVTQTATSQEKAAKSSSRWIDGFNRGLEKSRGKLAALAKPVMASKMFSSVIQAAAKTSLVAEGVFSQIRQKAAAAGAGIKDKLTSAWNGVNTAARGVVGVAGRAFAGLAGVASKTAAKIWAPFSGLSPKLSGAFSSCVNGAKKAFGAIQSAATVAATGIATVLGAAFTKGWSRLTTMENAEAALRGMGKNAKEIASIQASANKAVKGTYFGLDQGMKTAQLLSSVGVKSGKELDNWSRTIANASALSGSSMEDIARIFGQVHSAGRLMGGDAMQLVQHLIPAYNWIADSTGKSVTEVKKLGEEGKISAEMFEKAVRDHVGNAAKEMGSTTTGTISNMMAALGRVGETALEPLTGPIKKGAGLITEALDGVNAKLKGSQEAAGKAGQDAQKSAGAWGILGGTLTGSVLSGASGLITRVPVVGSMFGGMAGTVSKLAGPVGLVAGLFIDLWRNSEKLRDTIKGLWDSFAKSKGLQGVKNSLSDFGETITGLFDSFGNTMGKIGDFLAPLIRFIWDLGTALMSLGLQVVIDTFNLLGTIITWVFNQISNVLSWLEPYFASFMDAVTAKTNTVTGILQDAYEKAKTVFSGIWSWIAEKLGPIFTWLYNNVISPVWSGIKTAISVAWNIISAILRALWSFISSTLGPVFTWLWQSIITPAWNAISTAIRIAWAAISIIFQAIWYVLKNTLGPAFTWLYQHAIKPAWDNIKTAISTVWNWLKTNVFDRGKTVAKSFGDAFTSMKNSIKTAFDQLKAVAAKPVNFIINTVYNDGVKKGFDWVAEKIGSKTRLPKLSPIGGYAKGGVLPGYTPGRDIHRFFSPTAGILELSGGEGIIRPDALRRLGGKAWLDRVNATRGRGFWGRGDAGLGLGHWKFAKGGVWESVKSAASWAWAKVKDTASLIGEIFSDPLGAAERLLLAPARSLLARLRLNDWGTLMADTPKGLVDAFKSWFKGDVEKATGGGGGMALVNMARRFLGTPYVWGGSSIPPGLDCSGLVYYSYNKLGKRVPRLTAAGFQSASKIVADSVKVPGDLLFWGSPAKHVAIYAGNNRLIEEPRPGLSAREIGMRSYTNAGRYMAYDNGGYLPPGVSQVANFTGKPEPVFTSSQWATLRKGQGVGQENHFTINQVNDPWGTANAVARRLMPA